MLEQHHYSTLNIKQLTEEQQVAHLNEVKDLYRDENAPPVCCICNSFVEDDLLASHYVHCASLLMRMNRSEGRLLFEAFIEDLCKGYDPYDEGHINMMWEELVLKNNEFDVVQELLDIDTGSSLFILGRIYYQGLRSELRGVRIDRKNAEEYFLLAIKKNDANAMNSLGGLYCNIYKDAYHGEQYYLMAADKNNSDAMCNLGILYHKAISHKNLKKAEEYYIKAITISNHIVAFNNLASLYENDLRQYDKAEQYYLQAIEHGSSIAMFNLGLFYEDIQCNNTKAEQYYLLAIQQNHSGAMLNLGIMLMESLQYNRAEQYLTQAVSNHHTNAREALRILKQRQNN